MPIVWWHKGRTLTTAQVPLGELGIDRWGTKVSDAIALGPDWPNGQKLNLGLRCWLLLTEKVRLRRVVDWGAASAQN